MIKRWHYNELGFLLKESEINIANIRSEFYKTETIFQEIEQNFKDGTSDIKELNYWKDRLEFLRNKMTSEQRSLVMDDFDEVPLMHDKILQIVKLQEAETAMALPVHNPNDEGWDIP